MSSLEDWVVTSKNVFNPDEEEFKNQVGMNWVMKYTTPINIEIPFVPKNIISDVSDEINHAINIKKYYENELKDKYNNLDNIVIHQHISHIYGLVGYLSLEGSYLALTPIHDSNMKIINMPVHNFEEEREKILKLSSDLGCTRLSEEKTPFHFSIGKTIPCKLGRMYSETISDDNTVELDIGRMKKYIYIGPNGVILFDDESKSNAISVLSIANNLDLKNFYAINPKQAIYKVIIDILKSLGFKEIGSDSVLIVEKTFYNYGSILSNVVKDDLLEMSYDFDNPIKYADEVEDVKTEEDSHTW